MIQPSTLLAAAALSIGGAAIGIHLGQSAAAEIDPVHYSGREDARFFADFVPGGYDPEPAPITADVRWDGGVGSAAGRCIGCAEPTMAVYPIQDEPDYWPEDAYVEVVALPEPTAVEERVYVPVEVERYVDFPVTEAEARRQAVRRHDERSTRPSIPLYAENEREHMEAAPIGM